MADEDLTYLSYLHVPELLGLQEPRSEPTHPDELHFIIVHQALELWFKLLLHDLERLVDALDGDDWTGSSVVLKRVNHVMDSGLDQMRSLYHMPPRALHEFRTYLGTASGLQSMQFRELEILSGLRDPSYLKAVRGLSGGELPAVLEHRLGRRAVAEAHRDIADRHGIDDWSQVYLEAGRFGELYNVCEALIDYDECWIRWRNEHLTLVERTLGARARGTAGTAISYLERTRRYRYFPHLWEARHALTLYGGGELVE